MDIPVCLLLMWTYPAFGRQWWDSRAGGGTVTKGWVGADIRDNAECVGARIRLVVQLHLVLMPLSLIEIDGVPGIAVRNNLRLGVVSNWVHVILYWKQSQQSLYS